MFCKQSCLAFVIVVALALPMSCWARSDLELRIEKLENILDNQINAELLRQIDAMQQEMQDLRGKIEIQQNELKLLAQKQDKLFLNLDNRLTSINKPEFKKEEISAKPEQTEKTAYDHAYQLMTSKQYAASITAFKELVLAYPQGNFVPNAYYWLGDLYLLQWQQNRQDNALLELSRNAFKTVIEQHKGHHKAGDALLKLGLLEFECANWLIAKNLLDEVVATYPDSSRAKLAESKIQTMQESGYI